MHLQELVASTAWTEEIAEQISDRTALHQTRVMFTCDEVSVHAPMLPYAWDRLRVQPGSKILVTTEGGLETSEVTALEDVVAYITAL